MVPLSNHRIATCEDRVFEASQQVEQKFPLPQEPVEAFQSQVPTCPVVVLSHTCAKLEFVGW